VQRTLALALAPEVRPQDAPGLLRDVAERGGPQLDAAWAYLQAYAPAKLRPALCLHIVCCPVRRLCGPETDAVQAFLCAFPTSAAVVAGSGRFSIASEYIMLSLPVYLSDDGHRSAPTLSGPCGGTRAHCVAPATAIALCAEL
jgi:hypothetical protein